MNRFRAALLTLVLGSALPVVAAAAPARPSGAADFDTTCAPCRDFDQFANGGWLSRTKLPPGYSNYGAFDELYDRNEAVLRQILEATAADRSAKPGTDRARLADYYSSCMDSAGAEAGGGKPIAGLLADVDALASIRDVARQIAWMHANGVPALFGFFAAQDPKHSESVIAFVGQGGLGLPDRDYYTRTDSATLATRAIYVRTTTNLLQLAGEAADVAAKHADAVMALETALAQASMTNVQRRDPKATYHKMPWDSLLVLSPAFAWNDYAARRNAGRPADVNVTQPEFVRAVNGLLTGTPLDTWKAYLRARILRDAAPTLSTPYVKEWFALRQALTGTKEMLPRWKRCIAETDDELGEILGQEYVKRAFTPADKARMLEMVKNLEAGLGDRIHAAEWMGDSTRAAAATKLAAFTDKIGYPNQWKDYSSVVVRPGQHYANRQATRAFESARNVAKIGKPVDRNEWTMTPPTVNAYYSSSLNSINFPAGILQPPFFNPDADPAVNYGAIGAVIGHEITHGFDDQGRKIDATGALRDWWTADDAKRFVAESAKLASQYDAYEGVPGAHINGNLTLGENIADLGGLLVAMDAYHASLGGKPAPIIDGLTGDQRLFLGYAQSWRGKARDDALRAQMASDPHSPRKFRVIGATRNVDSWYQSFDVTAGQKYFLKPEDRVRVW